MTNHKNNYCQETKAMKRNEKYNEKPNMEKYEDI